MAEALVPPGVHEGLIISVDPFINAAQVCHDFGVPYAVIRTISDRADEDAHLDFSRFINSVARHHSLAIVEALLQRF